MLGPPPTSVFAAVLALGAAVTLPFGATSMRAPPPAATTAFAAVLALGAAATVLARTYRSADRASLLQLWLGSTAVGWMPAPLGEGVAVALLTAMAGKATPVGYASAGGLTALHVAASRGLRVAVAGLLRRGADPSATDGCGLTPLLYAVQGAALPQEGAAADVAALLLAAGASPAETDGKGRSAVYHAARLGRPELLATLLAADSAPASAASAARTADHAGYTPLHAVILVVPDPAVAGECAELLVRAGADVFAKTQGGLSALHMCARRTAPGGPALCRRVARWAAAAAATAAPAGKRCALRALLKEASVFGATSLHLACGAGGGTVSAKMVDAVLWCARRAGTAVAALLAAEDNDGMTALHHACAAAADAAGSVRAETIAALVAAGADPDCRDYSGSTPLVTAAYCRNPAVAEAGVAALLEAGADPTLENDFRWGPLHVALSRGLDGAVALLRDRADAAYLSAFDPTRPRDLAASRYPSLGGAHNRLPLAVRRRLLGGDHTVAGIARWLSQWRPSAGAPPGARPKVLVLTGAGISTGAGIPDFRSPDTGLYSDPRFRDAFDMAKCDGPALVWTLARDMFGGVQAGTIRPTAAHHFVQLLSDMGLLLRNYTQNIDGLEAAAGVPDEAVVRAHGSFMSATCEQCGRKHPDMAALWADLAREAADANEDGSAAGMLATPPVCPLCGPGSRCRPDVTMFGEALPRRYHDLVLRDAAEADLVLVLGTSLVTYPVAGLIKQVPPTTPRLLINDRPTGPFRALVDSRLPPADTASFRDAMYIGDCDAGVRALCDAAGWRDGLEALISSTGVGNAA